MNYQNLLKIALRAIAANKMRSFLTALGIIIGIAAVITMLAIGQGSKASIKANIAEMGSNMIMISPGADMRGGVRQDASSMETLKQADYQSIKEDCNYISAISPTVNSSGQWIYGNNNTQSSIYGVNQDYLSIRQLKVADGEMFTDTDIKAAAKVCILGQTVVDYLFPDGSDPIGKVVRFNSIPFRVVGVLQKKGYNSMGNRSPNECGSQGYRYSEPVPHRGDSALSDRRNHRSDIGSESVAESECLPAYCHSDRALEHHHELRRLYLHGHLLRLVSGKEGCKTRPYRGNQIRVKN